MGSKILTFPSCYTCPIYLCVTVSFIAVCNDVNLFIECHLATTIFNERWGRASCFLLLIFCFGENDIKGRGIIFAGSLYYCLLSLVAFVVFQVRWPLSLVISRKALTKYQLIFRFLFHCKHVDRQLSGAWQVHQVWAFSYFY